MSFRSDMSTTAPTVDKTADKKVLKTEVETTVHEVLIEGPDSLLKPKETRIKKNRRRMFQLLIGTIVALLVLGLAAGIIVKTTPVTAKKPAFLSLGEISQGRTTLGAFKSEQEVVPDSSPQLNQCFAHFDAELAKATPDTPLDPEANAMLRYALSSIPLLRTKSHCMKLSREPRTPQTEASFINHVKAIRHMSRRGTVALNQLALNLDDIKSVDPDQQRVNKEKATALRKVALIAIYNSGVVEQELRNVFQTTFEKPYPSKKKIKVPATSFADDAQRTLAAAPFTPLYRDIILFTNPAFRPEDRKH